MTRGERIREARNHWLSKDRARTARELIAKIGISEPAYYAWEADDPKQIKADNFLKFAKLTGYHPIWLEWETGPKMLADDERLRNLLESVSDFDDAEFDALMRYVELLLIARKQRENPK